jgi:hypothetical protein
MDYKCVTKKWCIISSIKSVAGLGADFFVMTLGGAFIDTILFGDHQKHYAANFDYFNLL